MTIAELERAVASKQRIARREAQEKATFDWILGDLIGRSIGRLYNSSNKYPDKYDAYPDLFESAEETRQKRQEKKQELSALRFKQFADAFNRNFKEVQKD
jgi:hypothetical protein